jgi:hypothetical protein
LKTPYEQVYNQLSDTTHLRPFGCVGYAIVPKETRSKLEPTRQRCRLIGYLDDDASEELQGYRLLRESDNVVVESGDVLWDEVVTMSRLPDLSLYDEGVEGDNLFRDPSVSPVADAYDFDSDLDSVLDSDSSSSHSDYDSDVEVHFEIAADTDSPLLPHFHQSLVSPANILDSSRVRRPRGGS